MKKTFFSNSVLLLGFSLLALTFSLSTWTKSGNYLFSFGSHAGLIMNFVLGILHAIHLIRCKESFGLTIKKTGSFSLITDLISYTIMCTAFYNVVLLPFSGLGILECAIIMVYLLGNMICSFSIGGKKSGAGQSPMTLFIFALILMALKLAIFFIFQDNLYDELFQGNALMRTLLFLAASGSALLLLANLTNAARTKISITKTRVKKSGESFWNKVSQSISSFGKSVVAIFTGLFSGPVLIVILLIIILFAGAFIFAFVKSIFDNAMNVLEPLMKKILSTGENSITLSIGYTLCQLAVLLIYFVFIFLFQKSCEKSLNEDIGKLLEDNTLNNPNYRDANRNELKNRILSSIENERNPMMQIEYKNNRNALEKIAETEYRSLKE